MNVKKLGRGMLALVLALALTSAGALAELSFNGKVVASETADISSVAAHALWGLR